LRASCAPAGATAIAHSARTGSQASVVPFFFFCLLESFFMGLLLHCRQARILAGSPPHFFARQPRYVACVDWPHCAQNFAPGAIAVPHCRQAAGSIDVPHCWQKRAPATFTARQAGQALPPGGGPPWSRPWP